MSDSGGSLCEVVDVNDPHDAVLQCLSQHTMLVYIRGTADHARMLVERFRKHPKPMYYNPGSSMPNGASTRRNGVSVTMRWSTR